MITILNPGDAGAAKRFARQPRRWVAGLIWNAHDRVDLEGAGKPKARGHALTFHAAAAGEDATHTVVATSPRDPMTVHLGTATLAAGEAGTHYPGALLALAAVEHRNWVGVFPLAGGHVWSLVVSGGRLMPDGDRVTDATTAEQVVLDARHDFGSDVVVERTAAPEDTQQRLSEWASSRAARKVPALRPVKADYRRLAIAGCAGLALLALVAGGAWWWSTQDTHHELTAAERRAIIAAHTHAKPAPVVLPWTQAPAFDAAVARCVNEFASHSRFESGWELTEWHCTPGQARLQWTRLDYGRFSQLPPGATSKPTEPNIAERQVALSADEARGWSPLVEVNSASRLIMDLANLSNVAVDVRWGKEATREVSTGQGKETQALGYARHTVTFTSAALPGVDFFVALANLPSLTFAEISRDQSGWSLVANLYSTPLNT